MGLVLDFRRAAWFVPAFFLNILFLGTSHVLARFPISYWALYQAVIAWLSAPLGGDPQTFYDLASIALTGSMMVLTSYGFWGNGSKRAFLRSLQVCSFAYLPLGTEVYLFDNSEWNLHFASFQAHYGLIPWFTNSDLFALALSFAIGTSLILTFIDRVRAPSTSADKGVFETESV